MRLQFLPTILGLAMALPSAMVAQNQYPDDQSQDQYSKPSPNVAVQDDQGYQNSANQDANQNHDQQSADRSYDQPADHNNTYPSNTHQSSADQDYGQTSDRNYDRTYDQNSNQSDQSYDQNYDQSYDQQSNRSNDQNAYDQGSYDQPSTNRGPADPGLNSNNSGYNEPSYNTPAPEENNVVARVSVIKGDVSTQASGQSWTAAAVNAPVVNGDSISTGDKSRAELQLDFANTLRLSEHSQANITQLTRSQIQIQLANGMANYSVFGNSDATAEIDAPNVAIRTEKRDSSFRILVTGDDHTEVLVRKGEVEITTQQGGTRVSEGQFITIQGVGDQAQYKIGAAPDRDDFDQWNSDRDSLILNAASRKHTDPYYVGTEDLDAHGTWSDVADYGEVWRPNDVSSDWAPYRDGRWVYEPYWGWTWVSADSWGWAPYHYGRWMMIDGGWGWWPGPIYGNAFYRPIWAPAYVSFFGGGFGVGFGFGGGWGSIGWLPLGPCDHFYPWYGRFGGRFGVYGFDRFNRGGFAALHGGNRYSNVNLALHNANFRGATSVSGREFGTGHMRAHAMSHNELRNARFTAGRVPVNPSRESYSATGRAAAPSTMHNGALNQRFFSSRGFVSANSNRTAANRAVANGRESGRVMNRPMPQTGTNRSFDRPNQGSSARGNSASANRPSGTNNGGWQKFSTMPPRTSSPSSGRGSVSRSGSGSVSSDRPPSASSSRGSYRSSSPRSASPEGRSYGAPSRSYGSEGRSYSAPPSRSSSHSYGSEGRTYSAPPSRSSNRSYGSDSREYGSSRPTLNMRQPIVAPRSNSGGGYGGGRSAPSYGGGGAPSHSAPSYGGAHSAPSGGSSPHGGSSAPHGNNNSSHGNGHGQ